MQTRGDGLSALKSPALWGSKGIPALPSCSPPPHVTADPCTGMLGLSLVLPAQHSLPAMGLCTSLLLQLGRSPPPCPSQLLSCPRQTIFCPLLAPTALNIACNGFRFLYPPVFLWLLSPAGMKLQGTRIRPRLATATASLLHTVGLPPNTFNVQQITHSSQAEPIFSFTLSFDIRPV